MTETGEALITATLSFLPRHFAWNVSGQTLVAVGYGNSTVLDSDSGQVRSTASWSAKGEETISSDGKVVTFAGGGKEAIIEYEEPRDCSELPLEKRAACEKYNREHAVESHVVGYKTLPNTLCALSGETGKILWEKNDLIAQITSICYSPDNALLLGTSNENAFLFDATNGAKKSEPPIGIPQLGAFSRDARRLVTAETTGLALTDTSSGATRRVTPFTDPISQLAFTQDDSVLVVATRRQAFTVRSDDGSVVRSVDLQGPATTASPTVFSPDGKLVVAAGGGWVTLWDLADGSRLFATETPGSKDVCFNPALPEIAIASDTGVKVVTIRHGATVWEKETGPLAGMAYSPDGMRLALCGTDGVVRVYSMSPASVSHRVCDGPVAKIALTSGPDPLAVAVSRSSPDEVSVFHAETGELVLTKPHRGEIKTLALSRDGDHFATGGSDGVARLFTTLTGEKLWEAPHGRPVNAVAFMPMENGDVLTAADDKTARRLDIGSGKERWSAVHPMAVRLVAASPDGRFAATACADLSTRIVDAQTGEKLFAFRHEWKIRVLAFSPTRSIVASGGDDDEVLIIDAGSGRILGKTVHTLGVTAAAFSHDGSLLATVGKDRMLQLCEVDVDPPRIVSPRAVSQQVTRLAFHPAMSQLALVSDDPAPMVTVTDATDGTELGAYPHPDTVNDLTYDPDGKLLATACEDTLVRVYPGRRAT